MSDIFASFAFSTSTKMSIISPVTKKKINDRIERRKEPVNCYMIEKTKGPQIAENLLNTE